MQIQSPKVRRTIYTKMLNETKDVQCNLFSFPNSIMKQNKMSRNEYKSDCLLASMAENGKMKM